MRRIYDDPDGFTTNQVDIGPPAVNTSVSYGLQALLVKYAGNGYACSQMPPARLAKCCNNYCDDPVVWRFVQDAWYTALVGADLAVAAYVDRAFEIMNSFQGIAFGLLAAVVAVVLGLWTCVFWPAALSVQSSNAGVLAIADAIPREAVRALIKRYMRLVQQLDALSEQVSGDAADGESDRGMDSDEDGDGDMPDGSVRGPDADGGSDVGSVEVARAHDEEDFGSLGALPKISGEAGHHQSPS